MQPVRRARAAAVPALLLAALLLVLAGCMPRTALGQPGPPASSPAAGAVSPAAGPAAAAALSIPVGSSDQAVTVGGLRRTFVVYRPAVLPAAAPLVVMLHGGFGTGSQAQSCCHWDTEADAGHFLVAFPDGLDRAWNTGGGCCGVPAAEGTDDVGFITAMVAAIERAVPVSPGRVYATGISNGGIMAYTLACQTSVFAAIAPDSATQLGPCPHPAALSVLHIHGTADQNIPYDGGEGDGVAHIDGPSVPALNAAWRRTDRCLPPVIAAAGVVTTSLARCPGGRAVELITIAGAGHQWPGSYVSPVAQRVLHLDPPSTALDATSVIWRFFAAHPRL